MCQVSWESWLLKVRPLESGLRLRHDFGSVARVDEVPVASVTADNPCAGHGNAERPESTLVRFLEFHCASIVSPIAEINPARKISACPMYPPSIKEIGRAHV